MFKLLIGCFFMFLGIGVNVIRSIREMRDYEVEEKEYDIIQDFYTSSFTGDAFK